MNRERIGITQEAQKKHRELNNVKIEEKCKNMLDLFS